LLVLAGCTRLAAGGPDQVAPAAAPAATRAATAPTPPAQRQRLRGQALMGKDGYGITLCDETRQRIVEFDPAAQAVLDKFLAGGAREFFLDGWGSSGANGHLRMARLERAYSEGPGCKETADGAVFQARGNEPFWSLTARAGQLSLQRPGQPALLAPYTAPELGDAGFSVAAQTSAGRLDLSVSAGPCSDGMSDAVYGWNAELRLGQQRFKGCAFAGSQAARP
jgi:putative lipoprotein